MRSLSKPGSSLHDTGTQRARSRTIGAAPAARGGTAVPPMGGVVCAVPPVAGAVAAPVAPVRGNEAGGTDGAVEVAGGSAQPATMPRIAATAAPRTPVRHPRPAGSRALRMWVIFLEMLAALALLLFIVWWTMFAGRRRGERRDDRRDQ